MIGSFKRSLLALIGLPHPPAFGAGPDVKSLKAQGYRVHNKQGRWHWYRWDGAFSGRYTTERAAWAAAAEDFESQSGVPT